MKNSQQKRRIVIEISNDKIELNEKESQHASLFELSYVLQAILQTIALSADNKTK